MFHVTSVLNRQSIMSHGLDSALMHSAPGIAGAQQPEVAGLFVCLGEWEDDWFVALNNTGGPVDVWAIDELDHTDLVEHADGHSYYPGSIPASKLTLVRHDVRAAHERPSRRARHGGPD